MNAHRRERGFTLIELLIIIAIVGVVAVIAIPIYSAQQAQSYRAAALSDGHVAALNVHSLVSGRTSLGTAPGNNTTAITLSGSTLTVTMTSPTPATPAAPTTTINVSPGTTISQSGISANTWCLKVTNNGQSAVYTQAGYQASATTCAAAGTAS